MAWSDMEPKEKGMVIATIVLFIIIGYMVYRLFFAGSHTPPPLPVAKPQLAAAKPAAPAAAAPANAPANNAAADLAVANNPGAPGANATPAAAPAPSVVEMPKRELTPEELALLEERRQVQQQYLQLVNQYQLTEMQNKVATSQSNLLKTQIETAQSEQQASRLGLVLPGQEAETDDKSLSGVALVYVEKKNGIWGGVLNVRGRYVTVKVGSTLIDGSIVSRISEAGLVINKDGERRTLTIPMVLDHESPAQGASSSDNSGGVANGMGSAMGNSTDNTSANNTGGQ